MRWMCADDCVYEGDTRDPCSSDSPTVLGIAPMVAKTASLIRRNERQGDATRVKHTLVGLARSLLFIMHHYCPRLSAKPSVVPS
jgi:hypothetical protein